ncbi:hypothetical protein XCCB100_4410 [Xanthomonas campestris pv. campestris]|uniref:Uncharacterized protein n=1 Tax=Xanthomonas campestris pv. campestris (strain B100) TaxID=509169 RepID=B0RMH0_XANCB|nr:hypothetical protein XCCB100_4410 [Xanthomonas campestris pv. campestris]
MRPNIEWSEQLKILFGSFQSVADELLDRHLGAIAHQQCGGQRGAHLLHYRVFSS